MKFLAVLAVAAMTIIGSGRVFAEDGDVQQHLKFCKSDDAFESGICLGMVEGVAGVMSSNCYAFRKGRLSNPKLAADLGGVSFGAMKQTFINWAEDNPQEWGRLGPVGMIIAFGQTFPCT